jgi:replicative DNA helicase
MALDEDFPVAFFSLEMSKEQVAQRMICSRQQIDAHKFRRRMLSADERERVMLSCGQFQDVPLYIDDTPAMSLLELRTKARRLSQQRNIKAVFVDYLQLMRVPGAESRQQEISMISGGLKALGRELRVPVIAMAQLNRMTEGREGHRPRMSDLRESGAIEQDADVIILLHREEYYKKDDPTVRNQAEAIVAKQRNGPTASVELHFDHRFTRFANRSHIPEPSYSGASDGHVPF